jgi:hypothetical protein
MIMSIGTIIGLLGVWLYACDRRNEFAPVCLGIGLLALVVGSYLQPAPLTEDQKFGCTVAQQTPSGECQ